MSFQTIAAGALMLLAAGATAQASPCADAIAALEHKLNASGAAAGGPASTAANARTVKTRQVIEDAKGADARGDAKGCDATLEKALRETGSAQQ